MKQTRQQRGYGIIHQKTRRQLLHNHVDGTPCEVCGRPMYKDKAKNWDKKPLHADHPPGFTQKTAANKHNNPPKRLLHHTCNSQGQAWENTTPPKPPQPAQTPRTFTWRTPPT